MGVKEKDAVTERFRQLCKENESIEAEKNDVVLNFVIEME